MQCVDAQTCPFSQTLIDLTKSVQALTTASELLARMPNLVDTLAGELHSLKVELAKISAASVQRDADQQRSDANTRWVWQIVIGAVMLGAGAVIGHMIGAK